MATVSGNVAEAVSLPEIPVMVTVVAPKAAALLAVRVRVAAPVVGFGETDAVTPLGRPEAARLTLPVKPYSGFTYKETVLEVPWPIVTLPGLKTVKVCAKIPSEKVVVALRLPEVPVTVSMLAPRGVELLAVSVIMLWPVDGFGEKDAVTPLGSPETLRLTLPVNPFRALT